MLAHLLLGVEQAVLHGAAHLSVQEACEEVRVVAVDIKALAVSFVNDVSLLQNVFGHLRRGHGDESVKLRARLLIVGAVGGDYTARAYVKTERARFRRDRRIRFRCGRSFNSLFHLFLLL